jgi:AraC-like DNA-binding protein
MKEALEHVSQVGRQLGQIAEGAAVSPPPSACHEGDIEQIARQVRADPCADYDFQEAARRCHVSYGHFRRLFRRHTGRPPYDYMLLWRMRRAARALRDLSRPVKAVAREVGYDDPRQFSRMFRKKMGMSPTAYRQGLARRE